MGACATRGSIAHTLTRPRHSWLPLRLGHPPTGQGCVLGHWCPAGAGSVAGAAVTRGWVHSCRHDHRRCSATEAGRGQRYVGSGGAAGVQGSGRSPTCAEAQRYRRRRVLADHLASFLAACAVPYFFSHCQLLLQCLQHHLVQHDVQPGVEARAPHTRAAASKRGRGSKSRSRGGGKPRAPPERGGVYLRVRAHAGQGRSKSEGPKGRGLAIDASGRSRRSDAGNGFRRGNGGGANLIGTVHDGCTTGAALELLEAVMVVLEKLSNLRCGVCRACRPARVALTRSSPLCWCATAFANHRRIWSSRYLDSTHSRCVAIMSACACWYWLPMPDHAAMSWCGAHEQVPRAVRHGRPVCHCASSVRRGRPSRLAAAARRGLSQRVTRPHATSATSATAAAGVWEPLGILGRTWRDARRRPRCQVTQVHPHLLPCTFASGRCRHSLWRDWHRKWRFGSGAGCA